jgi:hypothetical protein
MQPFQLSIPEPCHQSWQQMTPTEQGRFCKSCAKEVVDFSTMTDKEVLNYFVELKDKNVCGRALPSQLERAITMPAAPVKKRFWYLNYMALFFLFFSKASNTKAQTKGKISIANTNIQPGNLLPQSLQIQTAENTSLKRIIAGKIMDANGKGIPFATVHVKGSNVKVITDQYGVYSIKVNTERDVLEVVATGHGNSIFTLAGLKTFNFVLAKPGNEPITVTAGIMICKPVPKNIAVAAKLLKISGNITDEAGSAVPYASVNIKNSAKGVSADAAGKFSISVTDTETEIEITALGFKSNTITAGKINKQGTIVLENAFTQVLGEIVIAAPSTSIRGRMVQTGVIKKTTTSLADTIKSVVNISSNKIKIYPNPVVRGNSFTLFVKTTQPGMHIIEISDAAGRTVLQKQLNIFDKIQNNTIETYGWWGSGTYFLRVIGNDKKVVGKSSFILE